MADIAVTSSSVSVVTRALEHANAAVKQAGKTELRAIGGLVERDSEHLSRARIPTVGLSWSQMRVGQSPRLVYVVPVNRGTKIRSKKRKNFAPLMLNRAMRPALERQQPEVKRRFDALLANVCREFNA